MSVVCVLILWTLFSQNEAPAEPDEPEAPEREADVTYDVSIDFPDSSRDDYADVTAVKADALDGMLFGDAQFDAIFSNPPYLTGAEMDSLMREVAHEPKTALYGGEDGLDFYRALIPAWVGRLRTNGFMAVETGETQGNAVSEIMRAAGLRPEVIKDYAGLDRVVIGERSPDYC